MSKEFHSRLALKVQVLRHEMFLGFADGRVDCRRAISWVSEHTPTRTRDSRGGRKAGVHEEKDVSWKASRGLTTAVRENRKSKS